MPLAIESLPTNIKNKAYLFSTVMKVTPSLYSEVARTFVFKALANIPARTPLIKLLVGFSLFIIAEADSKSLCNFTKSLPRSGLNSTISGIPQPVKML